MVLHHHVSHPTTPAGPGFDNVVDGVVPLHAERGISARAELGQADSMSLVVADPSATQDFKGDWRWYMVEDAITDPTDQLVWNGYIGPQRIDHGDGEDWEPWGRVWTLTIEEMAEIVDFRVIRGADTASTASDNGNRPEESAGARLRWLLASPYLNTLYDNGLIDWPLIDNLTVDANDYRDQRPSAMLNDIAKLVNANWWPLYLSSAPSGQELTLAFFVFDTSDLYTSTLRISNDGADIDDADPATQTTFPPEPIPGASLDRDPQRVAAGCELPYTGGRLYGYRYPTAYEYAFRDQVAPTADVKTATKAQALLDRYLLENSEQDERVTQVRIQLPASRLNAVKHGQRIQCRFVHYKGLEGWGDGTTFRWCRVISKAFSRPDNDAQTLYDVDLELSPQSPLPVHQVILSSNQARGAYAADLAVDTPTPLYFFGATDGALALPMPTVVVDTDGMAVRIADPTNTSDSGDPFGPACVVQEIVVPDTFSDGLSGAGPWQITWEQFVESVASYSLAPWWNPADVHGSGWPYQQVWYPGSSPTKNGPFPVSGSDAQLGACLFVGSATVELRVNGLPVNDILGNPVSVTAPAGDPYQSYADTHWTGIVDLKAGDRVSLWATANGSYVLHTWVNGLCTGFYGAQQALFAMVRLP